MHARETPQTQRPRPNLAPPRTNRCTVQRLEYAVAFSVCGATSKHREQTLGRMFEARLTQGGLLKKLVDVVKDVNDNCNFDCSSKGFGLQAIDNAHVAGVVDAARRRL